MNNELSTQPTSLPVDRMDIETPWGRPQTISHAAEGILIVSTASHGGFLLSPARVALMPDSMKRPLFAGQYAPYEEDCDWCIPALVFEKELRAFYEREGVITADEILAEARSTLKHWHPDVYEAYYNMKLQPGESRKRDEQLFFAANKDTLLAIAAWGNWKEGVPAGMVAVRARCGGHMGSDRAHDRFFLVPEKEYYRHTHPFAFKIHPERHREIPPLA